MNKTLKTPKEGYRQKDNSESLTHKPLLKNFNYLTANRLKRKNAVDFFTLIKENLP